MINLLLLKDDAERGDELTNIFSNAGYRVTQVEDIASCCRHLMTVSSDKRGVTFVNHNGIEPAVILQPQSAFLGSDNREPSMGITIFTAGSVDSHQKSTKLPALPAFIVSLARRLTPGWRLSIRSRSIEAPNGLQTKLTSLEFSFIKIFAFVDPGEAVSRKKIVQTFGEDYLTYDQNRVDTLVRRLRKKIERDVDMKLPLNTVRVRGFAFDDLLTIDV